jgi:hypothetical protein
LGQVEKRPEIARGERGGKVVENRRSLGHEGKTLLNPVNFFWILNYMAADAAVLSPPEIMLWLLPGVGVTFYGPAFAHKSSA